MLFDAHLQPDGLTQRDLETLFGFGVTAALLPAHAGATRADPEALLAHFRDLANVQAPRVQRAKIRPFVALGIPSGCRPERDSERVLDSLPEICTDARLVAIGLIGLGDGAREDEALLARQLELAMELELPAMLEVTASDRAKSLRRTLAIVAESGIAAERVVVARARVEDAKSIVGCGHGVGLSVRSGRVNVADAVSLVQSLGHAQLVLGSDAGDGASDLLALPRTADALQAAGLSASVVRKVTAENAARILRVDPSILGVP